MIPLSLLCSVHECTIAVQSASFVLIPYSAALIKSYTNELLTSMLDPAAQAYAYIPAHPRAAPVCFVLIALIDIS